MHYRKTAVALGISLALTTLAGCGGGNDTATTTGTEPQTLSGSVFKGPIDNATIRITNAAGELLASGGSRDGLFEMALPELGDSAIFIESLGGSYTDEATGETVRPDTTAGLMTVFSATELQRIVDSGHYIAMTPETTLLAKMVKRELAQGKTVDVAIGDASALIKAQLIDGTTPLPGIAGDEVLRVGNLTSPLPATPQEALARNRAISFSYEVQNLNLAPEQVFELIDTRAADLEDGQLDGRQNATPLQLVGRDDSAVELADHDQRSSFGQARAELLNTTLNRFMSGDISDDERGELTQLGIDTAPFEQMQQQNSAAAEETTTNLLATNLPAFRHLPVMSDEDGDPNDNRATYTLNPEANVLVPVETPNGSWITPMLRYNGSALPPVIRASRGDVMTLPVTNNLNDTTTIHWHGFKIPGDQDGGPDFPILAGESRTYSFTINQPAASLWFHPHPHQKTGEQVYHGLAGLFLVDDEISRQLEADNALPAGDYDIPLLIQDRRFQADNGGVRKLSYMDRSEDADGNLGNIVLVNGVQLPRLEVESRHYRFRLYNASNARTMDITLSDGSTFHVVGTDGGLLPEPVATDHILLGAAERAEIVIDFGNYSVDDKVMLVSRAFNGSPMAGMGSGMGGSGGMSGMAGIGNMNRSLRMAHQGENGSTGSSNPNGGADVQAPDQSAMTGGNSNSANNTPGTPSESGDTGTNANVSAPNTGNGTTANDMEAGSELADTDTNSSVTHDGTGSMGATEEVTGNGMANGPSAGDMGSMETAANTESTGMESDTGETGPGEMASSGMEPGEMGAGMAMGDGGMSDMGGTTEVSDMMLNGQRFDIMRFDITATVVDDVTLYTRLPDTAEIHTRLTEVDATQQRSFVMSMGMGGMNGGGMTFLINGKSFDMNRIDETVEANATEIWTISNRSPMAHPFHAHAIQWQILDRNNQPATGVDLGWKDTVLVQPGETVRFIGRFDPAINSGNYMYHCHILEHEDAGMMGMFEVR